MGKPKETNEKAVIKKAQEGLGKTTRRDRRKGKRKVWSKDHTSEGGTGYKIATLNNAVDSGQVEVKGHQRKSVGARNKAKYISSQLTRRPI